MIYFLSFLLLILIIWLCIQPILIKKRLTKLLTEHLKATEKELINEKEELKKLLTKIKQVQSKCLIQPKNIKSFQSFVKSLLPDLTRAELLVMIKQMHSEKQKEKIDESLRKPFEVYAEYINSSLQTYLKQLLLQQEEKINFYQTLHKLLKSSPYIPEDINPFSSNPTSFFPKTFKEYTLIWFPFLEEDYELLNPNNMLKEESYLSELLISSYDRYQEEYLLYKQQLEQMENKLMQLEKLYQENLR
jgi:hypothetical protein